MTKLKLLALGLLAATSVSTAQAEDQWTVGAGVGVINSPYKQYDRDVYPVPVVTYEGDNFWFRGLGGGYYLWNDNADKTLCYGVLRSNAFQNQAIAITTSCAASTNVKAP